MNDMNALVKQLHETSDAYSQRWFNNGPGHEDNEYLQHQSMRFYVAAEALQDTINAAAAR